MSSDALLGQSTTQHDCAEGSGTLVPRAAPAWSPDARSGTANSTLSVGHLLALRTHEIRESQPGGRRAHHNSAADTAERPLLVEPRSRPPKELLVGASAQLSVFNTKHPPSRCHPDAHGRTGRQFDALIRTPCGSFLEHPMAICLLERVGDRCLSPLVARIGPAYVVASSVCRPTRAGGGWGSAMGAMFALTGLAPHRFS